MKDKPNSAGMILILLTLSIMPFLAGCGDFWKAPNGGTGTTASTTTLAASPASTAATGTSVTLTATVAASSSGNGAPSGTVTFYSGTTSLGTGTLSSGTATLNVTFSSPGTLSLTADYGGDSTYAASTSTAVSFIVTGLTTTTTTLTASPTSPGANDLVTLTAIVAPAPTGTTNETVTFLDGATSIGTGTLSSGTTSISTSFSTANMYSLTATYIGDSTYATSTGSLNLTVGSTSSPTNCGLQDSANSVDAIAAIAYATSGDYTLSYPFITVSTGNESALCAEGSGTAVTVTNPTIDSSSVGSNSTDSSNSGTNAAVLAYGSSATSATGGSITITGGGIATTGNFGNGVFASGDGATISLSGTTITTGSATDNTVGAGASGVVAAVGGTVTATTGTITAYNSEAVVVDGASSVTLNGTTLNSAFGNYRGILLNQNSSSVGTSSFTMTSGSLTYTCNETTTASCANGVLTSGTSFPATLFAVADTTAAISLTDVTVTNDTPTSANFNGTLLEAEALNGSTAASNVTFTAKGETLTGDVIVDAISTAALTMNEDSSSVATLLTGAINHANSGGAVSLTLDSASSWTVSGDSYLTNLTGLTITGSGSSATVTNVTGGGFCVYYSGTVAGAPSGTTQYTLVGPSGTGTGILAPTGTTGLACI